MTVTNTDPAVNRAAIALSEALARAVNGRERLPSGTTIKLEVMISTGVLVCVQRLADGTVRCYTAAPVDVKLAGGET